MKFLQFGMKYGDSKNYIVRTLAGLALKIAEKETENMENRIAGRHIEIPACHNQLEKIFERIREQENEGRSK